MAEELDNIVPEWVGDMYRYSYVEACTILERYNGEYSVYTCMKKDTYREMPEERVCRAE